MRTTGEEGNKKRNKPKKIDPTQPRIVTETTTDGKITATLYGAQANWCRISNPEPVLDTNGAPAIGKDGKPRMSWSVNNYLPKGCPGIEEYQAALIALRKRDLKGVGKLIALKDGDKEIERLVNDLGKDPEKLTGMAGKWIIPANTFSQPFVHNEIYSGAIVVCRIQIASYDRDGSKGIKAYLQEIGRVSDGERIGGSGAPVARISGISFATDSAPAESAPAPSATNYAKDKNPWE